MQPREIAAGTRPVYNIDKSYAENAADGPFFEGNLFRREWAPESDWVDILGYRAASPIGIPAGPLLTSQWVALAANLGFDILTYKTIRSRPFAGHPQPNIVFVEAGFEGSQTARRIYHPPEDPAKISITNSFGMPSMSSEFLRQDIRKAKQALKKGQILIVSVMGTGESSKDVIEDFINAALIAKESGADIIEANLSCPNIKAEDGLLYCDIETSYQIALSLSKAVFPLPLLVKAGVYPHRDVMKKSFEAFARANVRGICGINTISARVLNEDGSPALGQGREVSGICGDAIRVSALQFIREAHEIIRSERLDLDLLGCGGIMLPEHFDEFLAAGAKAALSATGMMWNPYLAEMRQNKLNKEKLK